MLRKLLLLQVLNQLENKRRMVTDFMAKGEKLIYDLYGVSNHFGNMGFGHYTAYCQNPVTNQWYEFDDSRVSQVNPSMLKNSSGSWLPPGWTLTSSRYEGLWGV